MWYNKTIGHERMDTMARYAVTEYRIVNICDADGNFIKKEEPIRTMWFTKESLALQKVRCMKAQGRIVGFCDTEAEYPF